MKTLVLLSLAMTLSACSVLESIDEGLFGRSPAEAYYTPRIQSDVQRSNHPAVNPVHISDQRLPIQSRYSPVIQE